MMRSPLEGAFPPGIPPYHIQYRNVGASPAVEREIEKKLAALWRVCPEIQFCRVLVELPHRRHQKGNNFHVRLALEVPGPDLVVSRHHPYQDTHESAVSAVQDAFESLTLLAEEFGQKRRREVKPHRRPLRGRVEELHPEEDYGLIRTAEGRMVYFHRHSVKSGSFDGLKPGIPVAFDEEMGDKGPQAVFVKASRRRTRAVSGP